jgi:hypothetical protein
VTVSSPSAFQVANAIPKSTVTAKGDLIVGTGSGTYTNQGVGADGTTLVANSSASTGVSWAGPSLAAGKNFAVGGGFDIWQRGTSFTASNSSGSSYWADRWSMYFGTSPSSYTLSRQAGGPTGFPYFARVQRNSGQTDTNGGTIGTSIEIANATLLAGQSITVSWYARAGANYSVGSSLLAYDFRTGTGSTDANGIYNTYTGQVSATSGTKTLTSSWQRFSATATAGSSVTQIVLTFTSTNFSGTAGAADYYDIAGVQLELGSVATAFSRAGGTLQGELAACQRYYEQTFVTAATESTNKVSVYSDANYTQGTRWKVTKRTAPSVTVYSSNGGTANRIRQISTNVNYTPASIADIGVDGFNIFTGIAQSNMMDFHYTASAEL